MASTAPTVGLHEDAESVVSALVARALTVTGMDAASAAVRDADGHFPMTVYRGIRSDAYRSLRIRPGAGLGGLVLTTGESFRLPDYHASSLITADYRDAVDDEGLHGFVCVPVTGPDGVAALLYTAVRTSVNPGDIAVIRLEGLAAEAGTALHHLAAKESHAELAGLRQRQAIAARLHDSIAQTLFSVGALARRARGETDPGLLIGNLAEIETVTSAARSELRETPRRSVPGTGRSRPGPGAGRREPDVHRGLRGAGVVESSRFAPRHCPGVDGVGGGHPPRGPAKRRQARRRRAGDGDHCAGDPARYCWCCRCIEARMPRGRPTSPITGWPGGRRVRAWG